MKTDKLFKMDLDTGEAEFILTKEFNHLDPLLKADILKDWIEDLLREYKKTLTELNKELTAIHFKS